MTNLNVAASPKTELTRIVPVTKRQKDPVNKIDFKAIIESWKPTTGIIERLKKNDPKNTLRIKITPDIALDMLTLNDMDHNRDLDKKRIKEYTTAMKDKKWKEGNGDTLCISTEMKLLNGQKRLWSIWLSKQTIEYLVCTGVDPEAFAFMDIGQNRSAKNVTEINGYKNIASPLSAAIKIIILFEKRGVVKSAINSSDVYNYEINDWQQEIPRMKWMVTALDRIKVTWMEQTNDFFTAPQWLAAFYILKSLPGRAKHAEEFLNQFASGEDLRKGSPIKVARSYFEKEMEQFTRYKRRKTVDRNILSIKFKVLFEAWNLHLAKATVQEIKIDRENALIPKPKYQSQAI